MKLVIRIAAAAVLLTTVACHEREREFDVCGQVDATEVVVSAENSGKIMWLNVDEGDRLEKGELVGFLDTVPTFLQKRELEERKEGAKTKVVDIERQLRAQYANLENLKTDYERYRTLLSKDAGTQKQVDDLAAQIKIAESDIAAQRQTYEKNNGNIRKEMDVYDVQVAQKADLLKKCYVTSPINGTVLTKYAEEGETVTSGKSLFKIANLDDVFVRAYFSTKQLSDIKLGDKVKVVAEDGTDNPRTYEGVIRWISDEAEFTPKNIQTKDEQADLVYATKVAVKNDGFLRIGMYAYVLLK